MRNIFTSALILLLACAAHAKNCELIDGYDLAAQTANNRISDDITSNGSTVEKIEIIRIYNIIDPQDEGRIARVVDVRASVDDKSIDYHVAVAIDVYDCHVSASTFVKGKNTFILPD